MQVSGALAFGLLMGALFPQEAEQAPKRICTHPRNLERRFRGYLVCQCWLDLHASSPEKAAELEASIERYLESHPSQRIGGTK